MDIREAMMMLQQGGGAMPPQADPAQGAVMGGGMGGGFGNGIMERLRAMDPAQLQGIMGMLRPGMDQWGGGRGGPGFGMEGMERPDFSAILQQHALRQQQHQAEKALQHQQRMQMQPQAQAMVNPAVHQGMGIQDFRTAMQPNAPQAFGAGGGMQPQAMTTTAPANTATLPGGGMQSALGAEPRRQRGFGMDAQAPY